jgi:SAM-dependent MidA family methyltransferase
MATSATEVLLDRIRSHGPITVAEFMDVALYDPEHGYYSTAERRSGRTGDFYTNVDVGRLFGEMLAVQVAEMFEALGGGSLPSFDLVEAGASDGRLMRDILDALAREFPECYANVRVTLVERSARARRAQTMTLADHQGRIAGCDTDLPALVNGLVLANELLDAFPLHVVQFDGSEIREVCVTELNGSFTETVRPLADRRIADQLPHLAGRPGSGERAEVSLAATDWIGRAASSIERGYLLLIDYGAAETDLISTMHPAGTLVAYRGHTTNGARWLDDPGHTDITGHVNLTAIQRAAHAAGMRDVGLIDQSYFLLNLGLLDRLPPDASVPALKQRLAAQTLLMPGGLGSTMKVMAFAKGVERATLRGFSAGRLTR